MLRSRFVLLAALSIASANAFAISLRIDLSGPVIPQLTDWHGSGPLPGSFEATFVIDTQAFASKQLTFVDHGTGIGPRLDAYQFNQVAVSSISLKTDGIEIWSDPAGLTLTFSGDNPSGSTSPLGGYFAFFGGSNAAGQEVFLSYDSAPGLTKAQTLMGDDPLANILLGQQVFVAIQGGQFIGEWGQLQVSGEKMEVMAVPEPGSTSLVLSLVVAFGARRLWDLHRKPQTRMPAA